MLDYIDRTNYGIQQSGQPAQQAMNSQTSAQQNGHSEMNGAAAGGRDYRDDLRELLDRAHNERGLTRYRLCKQMGIDSGTLSNVLAKRRHFSLEKLEQILGLLGYRLTFAPAPGGPKEMV
jgi:ribosome-binding protein aMBF1 (putative translation factor)